jgi:hypothetical protein
MGANDAWVTYDDLEGDKVVAKVIPTQSYKLRSDLLQLSDLRRLKAAGYTARESVLALGRSISLSDLVAVGYNTEESELALL